jgi:prophage tail gpP-like protein
MSDDLTLICGAAGSERKLSGWTSLRVTRGVERMPSDFEIAMTERFPGEVAGVSVAPLDPCRVLLGNDLVLTGYVDAFVPSLAAQTHAIRVLGRSKCQDLVDCSAEWPGGQISGATVLGIAQKLAAPYGITVSGSGPEIGPVIPQFSLLWGESAFEVIERVCRYRGLLAYDGADGNLVLSRVGTRRAASGATQGVNVQEAQIAWRMDERFSDIVTRFLPVSLFDDAGDGGDIEAHLTDDELVKKKRHRLKYIVTESSVPGLDIGTVRAQWEIARRFGRSMRVTVTLDSWRDSAGALWQPNTLAPLALPALKLDKVSWTIAEVSFIRDEQGTRATLVLMPPGAFDVQPPSPLPFQDVTAAPSGP